MAMSYTTLIASKSTAGSIQSWLNRSTTDPDTVLTEAQAYIYTRLRHWRMKTEATGTMTVGQPYLAVPGDFIDCKLFRITGTYAVLVRRGDERFVQDRYEYDSNGARLTVGPPEWFYIAGNAGTPRIYFDNQPDQEYSYLLTYWQTPTALGAGNTTNWLTSFYPRLLRCVCMLIGVEFEKEAGQGQFDRTYWQQMVDREMQAVQVDSDRVERASDAPAEFA